jgi:hypothetical protein
LRADVAERLTSARLQRIDTQIAEGASAPLSLTQLQTLDEEIRAVSVWIPEQADERARQLVLLWRRTGDEILFLSQQLNSLGEYQRAERYLLMTQLARLLAGQRADQLKAEAMEVLAALVEAAQEALDAGLFDEARFHIDELAFAAPDYPGIGPMNDAVSLALFEQAFWRALVNDMADEAFHLFAEFSERAILVEHNGRFAQDALELATYFDDVGDDWRRGADWIESYRTFARRPLSASNWGRRRR